MRERRATAKNYEPVLVRVASRRGCMVAAATTAAGVSAYNKPDDMLAYGCGKNGGRAAGSIASNARPCC